MDDLIAAGEVGLPDKRQRDLPLRDDPVARGGDRLGAVAQRERGLLGDLGRGEQGRKVADSQPRRRLPSSSLIRRSLGRSGARYLIR